MSGTVCVEPRVSAPETAAGGAGQRTGGSAVAVAGAPIPPGSLCPFGDGRHKLIAPPWGRSCVRCHKTWEWVGAALVETYELLRGSAEGVEP